MSEHESMEAPTAGATNTGEHETGYTEVDLAAKVEQLFGRYTSSQFLLRGELIDLLGELGMLVTEEELSRYVISEKVDLETAVDVAQQIQMSRRAANNELGTGVSHVKNVGFCEYIKMKLSCSTKPHVEYKVQKPTCDCELTPRTILLSGTGVVMLLTGLIVICILSVMWIFTERDREIRTGKILGDTLGSFTGLFERYWLDIAGREASSEAATFTDWVQRRYVLETESDRFRMQRLASCTVSAQQNTFNKDLLDHTHVEGMRRRMSLTGKAIDRRPTLPISFFKTSLATWKGGIFEVVTVNRTDGSVFYHDALTDCGSITCDFTIPCLQDVTGASDEVIYRSGSIGLTRESSLTLSVHFAKWNLTTCAILTHPRVQKMGQKFAIANVPEAPEDVHTVIAISSPRSSLATPASHIVQYDDDVCGSSTSCGQLGTFMAQSLVVRKSNYTILMGGTAEFGCSVASSGLDIAVAFCVAELKQWNNFVARLEQVITYLNFAFVRSTEIVLAVRDRATGSINVQKNAFRFVDACYGSCSRSSLSSQNPLAGFALEDSSYAITADYRPAAVMGGYSYSTLLDIVVYIERDVEEIRGRASRSLVSILNQLNNQLDNLEIIALRPEGYVATYYFDPTDPCPASETCFDVDPWGVVFRGDCIHCAPDLVRNEEKLDVLTELLYDDCNCTAKMISGIDLYRYPFEHKDSDLEVLWMRGYTDQDMIATASFVDNLTLGLIVEWPVSTYQEPILTMVGISIGVAMVVVLLALIFLMFQSRRYLDSIEEEWSHYKEQISIENQKFAEIVVEILPASVAQKLLASDLVVAQSSTCSILFLSFVQFQKQTAGWDPLYLCGYLSYTNLLVSSVLRYYDLYKVRSIGDTFFALGGIEEDNDVDTVSNVTFNALSAASVVLTVFSYLFHHTPTQVPLLKNVAVSSTRKMEMPHCRVGIHVGNCTVCVVKSPFSAPNFDALGPNVSIAARLHQLAKHNSVNISLPVKEAIDRLHSSDMFEFSQERKTSVKNDVVTSLLVLAANVPVPPSIMAELTIRRSHLRVFFDERRDGEQFREDKHKK